MIFLVSLHFMLIVLIVWTSDSLQGKHTLLSCVLFLSFTPSRSREVRVVLALSIFGLLQGTSGILVAWGVFWGMFSDFAFKMSSLPRVVFDLIRDVLGRFSLGGDGFALDLKDIRPNEARTKLVPIESCLLSAGLCSLKLLSRGFDSLEGLSWEIKEATVTSFSFSSGNLNLMKHFEQT